MGRVAIVVDNTYFVLPPRDHVDFLSFPVSLPIRRRRTRSPRSLWCHDFVSDVSPYSYLDGDILEVQFHRLFEDPERVVERRRSIV